MSNKDDKMGYKVCFNCKAKAVTYLPNYKSSVCLDCGMFVTGNLKLPSLLAQCSKPNCQYGIVSTRHDSFICLDCETTASVAYYKLKATYDKNKEGEMVEPEAIKDDKVTDTLAQRGNVYGSFNNVAATAQALKVILNRDNLTTSQQEAIDMICSKLARIANGDAAYADSWLDIAGYAKLVYNELEDNGGKR